MIPLLSGLVPVLLAFQSPPPAPAPVQTSAPAPAPATEGGVAWTDKELLLALKDAKAQSKLVMVFFRADNNPGSTTVSTDIFGDGRVAEALKDVICVKVDTVKQRPTATQYNAENPPVVAWFNPDGTARDRIVLFKDVGLFLSAVSRIKVDVGTIGELRKKVEAKSDDLDARYDLYTRLKEFGDILGSSEQKAAILKLDPKGTSRGSHHFSYDRITSDIEVYWAQNGSLPMAKITELQTFVELETYPEIIWDGWMRLANTHAFLATDSASKGKFADAKDHRTTRRKFLSYAWRGLPGEPDYLHEWCESYGKLFWDERDELTQEDKDFLLTMSARCLEAFDQEAFAHDLRARAYFLAGKRVNAIEEAQRAAELDPSNKEYKARLDQFRGG